MSKIHCCYRIISTELKEDLLSMALPSDQDTVSLSISLSHQEASISLLSLSIREQTEWKSQSQKTNQTDHMTTSLSNSMKLWAMPYRATQDERVMVGSSDKTWSTGEGNGKPLQYSCLENPINSMKRQTDRTLKDELPRSVGAQYATGDQWRHNSRKNEKMEPKQKQHPVVDVTGDGNKDWCCKEQHCIGTWNVRSMNQGKFGSGQTGDGKSKHQHFRNQWTKWTGMGEFKANNHYIYYCGQESLEEME